jgi:hypothetical protein
VSPVTRSTCGMPGARFLMPENTENGPDGSPLLWFAASAGSSGTSLAKIIVTTVERPRKTWDRTWRDVMMQMQSYPVQEQCVAETHHCHQERGLEVRARLAARSRLQEREPPASSPG